MAAPPEPPNIKLYVDPNYWLKKQHMRTAIKARLQATRGHLSGHQKPPLTRAGQNTQVEGFVEFAYAQQSLTYEGDYDDDPTVTLLRYLEAQMRNMLGERARTWMQVLVCCNFDYFYRTAQLSTYQVPAYVTACSGADTNVLGKEWIIPYTPQLGPISSTHTTLLSEAQLCHAGHDH
jgi:hypothetical protein